MALTRSISLVTVGLLCLVAMPASGAMGATKKKSKTPPRPTVSSVAPLRAGVGDQLTIKGNNFVARKHRNTVLFKAGGKPAVSAKAVQATRTLMKVVIPKSVEKYMTVEDGVAQPTRFRLRVLAKRFANGYVPIARSPLIAPANARHDSAAPVAKAPGATAPGGFVADAAPQNVVAVRR
jgi:IPT/TIG domain